jgi:hypothetical protein
VSRPSTRPYRWQANRGFNRRDTPQALPDDIGTQCVNVELLPMSLGRRRPSSASVSLTSGPSEQIRALYSHYTKDSTSQELWAFSGTTVAAAHRRVAGVWSSVSLPNTPAAASAFWPVSATMNNKHFIAYDSAVNRLHVWDSSIPGVRVVGVTKPAVPGVGNTGAGAYAATERRYRVAMRIKVGAVITAHSELSDAVAFTPSGAGTAARVTKPADIDNATHWVVYGLIGTAGDTYDLYEELTELAVGTTTYDDTTAPSAYNGDFPPELGLNIPPPSYRFLLATDNRLFGAGSFETSASAGQTAVADDRVWFSRVLGFNDRGDDEAVPNSTTYKNYIDVGRNDGDSIVGLGGPVDGIIYVFKFRSIWRLIPTGIDTQPYRAEVVTRSVGANTSLLPNTMSAYNHRNIVLAEDHLGQPVLYFIGLLGAYRISSQGGVEYVGWDIVADDFTTPSPAAGTCYVSRGQIWWVDGLLNIWVYTPRMARLTEQGWSGGWSQYQLGITPTSMHAITMNDTLLDSSLHPVVGLGTGSSVAGIYGFSGTGAADGASTFSAFVQSKPFLFGGGSHRVSMGSPTLEAVVQTGVQPKVYYVCDHGRESRLGTAPALTAVGSETRVLVNVEGLEGADAQAVAILVEWAATQTKAMDAVTAPFKVQEPMI